MNDIRILEQDSNARGDLFGRLMADLFVALGYERPRLNIHKSGRELDLVAEHRLERRRAVAECKATAQPIGGDELNKFVGALDAERDDKLPITGYFISLAGFKETAIEQENRRRTPNILLNGPKAIEELVRGRILVAKDRATELAGRLCGSHNALELEAQAELLAHQRGWIWAIYWMQGKQRSHVALIHADGTPLARALADEIIADDKACGGTLFRLVCLNPSPSAVYSAADSARAVAAYARYLADECGFIHLDGLPADSDVGSKRMRLENLFVPLHLDLAKQEKKRQTVGQVLQKHPHLAPFCTQAALSPFNAADIRRLSVAWHREVVGDSEKVRHDAEQLADTIVGNDRIERLAVNPLLLTTLLLVKRWVGSLPTRRAVLYGKAVEVLLMTWNTEGHEPIPEEEALPQLCYVASAMILDKVERISRPRLAALLREAREALPTELGYVQGSVEEFIHRVEDRSSLLMMTGHDVEDGRLLEFFEFRHLTFQEFLTARAMVEGWHPGRRDSDTLADVLAGHFDDEKWREVIPLAAVLGGKATEALIVQLTAKAARLDPGQVRNNHTLLALANCLADEAAARPATIHAALREMVRCGSTVFNMPCGAALAKSRYGADLRAEARKALAAATSDLLNPADALLLAAYHQMLTVDDETGYKTVAKQCLAMLEAPELVTRFEGVSVLGRLAADLLNKKTATVSCRELLKSAAPILEEMLLDSETSRIVLLGAAYALEFIAANRLWCSSNPQILISRLYALWQQHENEHIRNISARALIAQPLASKVEIDLSEAAAKADFKNIWERYESLDRWYDPPAMLIVAYYLNAADDNEIVKRTQQLLKDRSVDERIGGRTLRELLAALGAAPPAASGSD